MSLQDLKTAAGNVKGYFGTSKSRGLGGVIQSHTQSIEADEATATDENGDICFIMKYNKAVKGNIELIMLNDTEAKAAREALTVGSVLTIPSNKALRAVEGLAIIDSVEESTSAGELAKFSVSYTARPNITEAITDDLSAATE